MQLSRLLLSPLAPVVRRKHVLSALCAAAILCGVSEVGYAQGTQMVVLHAPISTFGSGGNAGLIQVAEENASNKIVISPNQITLTITNGGGMTNPGSITTTSATYVNGIATFDLSTIPLYAYPANTTYTLKFADTVATSVSVSPTVAVTTVTNLYIVTNFTDTATGASCTNWYNSTSTPASLDSTCTLRQALTNIQNMGAQGTTTSAGTSSTPAGVSGVSLTVPGISGYTTAPTVTIAAPTGTSPVQATATAQVSGGVVTGLTLTVAGGGYTAAPGLSIAPPPGISGTIAFSNTTQQTINLASTLGNAVQWSIPLTIAGPGVNLLTISGATTAAPTTAYYHIFNERPGYGPLSVTDGSLILSGMTLAYGANGTASAGALYLYGSASLWNVYFYKNQGGASGGAVYWPSTATALFTGLFNYCVFDSNSDTSNAGAIGSLGTNGTITINNGLFYANTGAAGGAINFGASVASTVTYSITNSSFISNSATANGGALASGVSTATAIMSISLVNDTFYGNTASATTGGGAYYSTGASSYKTAITMTDDTFVGNATTTAFKGGAFYGASNTTITVNNSLVEDNSTNGASNPDGYPTSTVNGGLTDTAAGSSPYTSPYPSLASLGLSDLGTYGGPQLSIFTGGSYYASGIPGAASILAAPPTLVPLPGSPALKTGNGTNQGGITTDERGVSPGTRPTTGTLNVDAGAVQTSPSLVFTAETNPANTSVNTVFSPAPTVAYEDDNTILSNSKTALAFTLGISGGTLSGTTTASAKSTTAATFGGVAPTTAGSAESLTATAGGSSTGNVSGSSGTFNVTALGLTTSATPVSSGSPVTVTATLTPFTGSNGEVVTFYDNGNAFGTGMLTGGVASLTTTTLPVGNDSLTAIYAGDANYAVTVAPASIEVVTGTESVPAPIASGTPVTVTLTFTSNFTLGNMTAAGGSSPNVVSMGALNNPFSITGATCTVGTTYGPSTANPSCTVQVTYTPGGSTGGGLITGTVQVFDTSQDLQGSSNVVVARNR